MRQVGRVVRRALVGVLGLALGLAGPAAAVSPDVVISQVYGAGGNSGAPFSNDFVELFNRGPAPVSLAGRSIQYASATGTGNFGANPVVALTGSLAPGQRFLVQLAGGATGVPLPAPDVTGTINMSGSAGKVALVDSAAGLACNGGSTVCSPDQLALIRDLVGYGTANFFEGSAAPGLSTTTAALRAAGGCTDTDQNGADFATGAPNPRNSAGAPTPCAVVPAGITLTQSGGTTAVTEGGATDTYTVALASTPAAPVVVTLSPDAQVSAAPGVLTLTDTTPQTVTVSAVDDAAVEGPHTGTITHAVSSADPAFAGLTVPSVTVSVTDDDRADACGAPATPISQVQGSGATTPLAGQVTTVEGIVVGDFQGSGGLNGVFVQEEEADADADPSTSEGVFVFAPSAPAVEVGDRVRVTGTAGEFSGQTQLAGTSPVIEVCSGGNPLPGAAELTLPLGTASSPERLEGMRVTLPQGLVVTEHFGLGRFGEVLLSSGARLAQPTDVVAPGAAANALQAANDLDQILLDDGSNRQNPDPIRFARGGQPLSAANTLRGGDTITGVSGVLGFGFSAYRLQVAGPADFQPANPRPAAPPAVGGDVRVASFNLLNYFNDFTSGQCGTTGTATDCRGAESVAELERQAPKTVAAILGLGADVVAVNELENDGFGPQSAIQDLVGRLNAATAPGTWAFVDAGGPLGTDAITVGMLYRPARVTPAGAPAVLDTGAFGPFARTGGAPIQRNRPALAQAFDEVATGGRVVVVANHLKSKGSACADNDPTAPAGPDPDAGDGQGNCNLTRTAAAEELADWLATDPTGSGDADVLIAGDLNSYAKEDPIRALETAGYENLVVRFGGPDAYSYVFDGQWGHLDHALASPTLAPQVTGVAEWHINADEPLALDYNTNFKSAGQQTSLYAPDQFRSSDHDPVLVGLDLAAPSVDAAGPYVVAEGGSVPLGATAAGFGSLTPAIGWDLDGDGTFETTGATPSFSAAAIDGPATRTVVARACDPGGRCVTDQATVEVANADPVIARVTAAGPVSEGGSATVAVDASDPAGAADPLAYRFDCNDDGVFETGPQPGASAACGFPQDGARAVRVHVSDGDGGSAIGQVLVTVTDVAPTVAGLTLGGATGTACRGANAVTLDLSVVDPGVQDGPWRVRVDWGDGTVETFAGAALGAQPRRTHDSAPGRYTVRVQVSDAAGIAGAEATAVVDRRYATSPLLAPVNADGSSNFRRGSTIPLKVRITDCAGAPVPGLLPLVLLERTGPASGRQNEGSAAAPGGVVPLMRFDARAGQYVVNLSTRLLPTGAYRVRVVDLRTPARFLEGGGRFDLVR
jgi:hypothetical protein